MRQILHNPKHLNERRHLRSNQTKAEYVLWQELRDKKLGFKFRRQVSIGPFIVDFYCHELHLAIELDGPIHGEQKEYDMQRQLYLEKEGVFVLRYTNDKVLFDRDAVIEDILSNAVKREDGVSPLTSSQPSPEGEGDKLTIPSPSGEGQGVRSLNVLYEDNHLIAIDKPAGVLVQADESGDRCLMDDVKTYLKEKYHKPGNVFLGMLHRVDRPVSGIVLFAKTSKGASRLSAQIRSRTVEKVYHAIVLGKPEQDTGVLTNYLKKDEKKNIVRVFDVPVPDALEAVLSYRVVNVNKKYALLRVRLETGRPHQIRAQLSHVGHPILGDKKYGAPEALPDRSIGLAATALTFTLPTKDEAKTIEIDIPKSWQMYIT